MEGVLGSRLLTGIAVYGPEPEFPIATPNVCRLSLHQADHVSDMSMACADGARTLASIGAEIIAIVPGDIPLLDGEELDIAFRMASADQRTIVIPDRRGTGTNGLVFAANAIPQFRFGTDSFSLHLNRSEIGTSTRALNLASFALDIDTQNDLAALCRQPMNGAGMHTRRFIDSQISISAVETCSMGVMP